MTAHLAGPSGPKCGEQPDDDGVFATVGDWHSAREEDTSKPLYLCRLCLLIGGDDERIARGEKPLFTTAESRAEALRTW